MLRLLLLRVAWAMLAGSVRAEEPEDPYLWMEEVTGKKPLAWAKGRNAESVAELAKSEAFQSTEKRLLEILDSDQRIPYLSSKQGDFYYNFWRDAKNRR